MRTFKTTTIIIFISSLLILHQCYFDYVSDDAFISFRYVKNFVSGNGLVYNIGDKVEGYTNFLWIMILSFISYMGLNIVYWSRMLGSILSLFVIFIMYRQGKSNTNIKYPYYFLAPLLLAFNAAVAVWSVSGMETLLFTFLITWAITITTQFPEKPKVFLLASILFGFSTLTRPEGIILYGASSLYLFFFISKRQEKGQYWKIFFTGIVIYCAIYLPYFIWRYFYYGYLFPNTFYAKTGGGVYQQIRGFYYLLKFIISFGGFLVFCMPFAVVLINKKQFHIRLFSCLTIVWIGYVVWIGGDGLVCSRFFVPILPILYLMIQEGVVAIISKIELNRLNQATVAYILITGIVFGTMTASINMRRDPYVSIIREREMLKNMKTIGLWLKCNVKKETVLATNLAGALPYYSELKTIDMLGLNDTHIAHKKIDNMGKGSAGHEKYDWDYVLRKNPDYIMTDWPSMSEKKSDSSITYNNRKYKYESIYVGAGTIWNEYQINKGKLWFNVWVKN